MFDKVLDNITYFFYKNDKHRYFEDIILPRLINKSGFLKEPNEHDINTRCTQNIKRFDKQIKAGGYSIPINQVLEFYPIEVNKKLELLGEYVANTLFCQFLEPVKNKNDELVIDELAIKIDGTSKNRDLSTLGPIIKEPNGFKNIHLIFKYAPNATMNFLKLDRIYDCDGKNDVFPEHTLWLEYLQSGYTEMTLILTLQHALWHLMTAYITCVAKETIKDKNLVKVFKSSEQNIFSKAYQLKLLLLQSPLLFNTTIYENPKFINYVEEWVNNFVDKFDIDTHFNDYLLRDLNPEQLWIPGFKENLEVVKKFSNDIVSNNDFETTCWSWNYYKNINKLDKQLKISKLIQILYTVGSVYHSNTFEYHKLAFTELLYFDHKRINQTSMYNIVLNTTEWKSDYPIFGDSKYYLQSGYTNWFNCFKKSPKYVKCFENLEVNLKNTREEITKKIEDNKIFKPYIYTNNADKQHFSINTWNTRV